MSNPLPVPRELHEAYAQAVYVVQSPLGRVALTFAPPGLPVTPSFAEPWAIITACNPRSQTLSDAENELRMHNLRERLTRDGVIYLNAENRSPNKQDPWREPSVLIERIARSYVLALLHDFEQHAAVFRERDATGLLYADGSLVVMPVLDAT